MISIKLLAAPDSLAEAINALIADGATIYIIKLTRNASTYIVTYDGGVPPSNFFLLMEDGSYLLLETGDKIILD